MPQLVGVVFIVLLGLYIWQSIRWAGSMPSDTEDTEDTHAEAEEGNTFGILLKLIGSIAIIVVSAQILIPDRERHGGTALGCRNILFQRRLLRSVHRSQNW